MKDPGPDRTARSELDDLRASAVKIGSARVSEYSAIWTRPEGPRQSGSAVRNVAPATGHGPDDSLVSQVGDGAPDCGACYAEQVHEFLLRRHWLPDGKLS
jgi:hypothetical protein